jgi:hypothetical protein
VTNIIFFGGVLWIGFINPSLIGLLIIWVILYLFEVNRE